MVPVQVKICPDQICHLYQSVFTGYHLRRKLLVQQSSPCIQMIHLGAGFHYRCRAVHICPFLRGYPFGYRLMGQTSVGACHHHFPEIDMTGGWQHIDAVLSAFHIRPSGHALIVE